MHQISLCLGQRGRRRERSAGSRRASAKRQRGPPPRVLHTVAAHRVVLAAQSAWAKAMLNNVQPAEVRRGWL